MEQQKNSWEGVVGKTYEEVEKTIKQSNPGLTVHKVDEGAMVTMDFRPDRVRVYVNAKGVVTAAPRIG